MNRKGQGLMEYLLLLALVSLASIAVVSTVGQNLRARFASVSDSLRGHKTSRDLNEVDNSMHQLRGMDDAFDGAFAKKR